MVRPSQSSQEVGITNQFSLFDFLLCPLIKVPDEHNSEHDFFSVHVDILSGKISPVVFNRTFTDFETGIRDVLLTFPPLFKNKSSLRKMISQQEDRGFAKSKSVKGYDSQIRRY